MKNLMIGSLVVFVLAFFGFQIARASNSCPAATPEQLKYLIDDVKPRKLVFFSSWCSDCLVHLNSPETRENDIIFIAAFDKPGRAEKTLDKLGLQVKHCLYDKGITKHYGIKKVPAEIDLPAFQNATR